MSTNDSADRARRAALDEVDRKGRATWGFMIAAAVVEGLGLVLFLVLMDFSNRLHWLILIAACLVYGTVVLSMGALRADLQAGLQRIVRAVEEIGERPAEP